MKKVALMQSNYIPWKGYFDLIHDVDLCVFYDSVQYTRQDWRNRNQVFLSGIKRWLSIPVLHASLDTPIHEIRIDNRQPWQRSHFRSLAQDYRRAPYFEEVTALIQPFLGEGPGTRRFESLSDYNQAFLRALCDSLGVRTECLDSSAFDPQGRATDRVLDTLKKAGADSYLSGPSALNYLEEEKFAREGISLAYKDYSGYPEYPQFSAQFDHQVSVLDLLFQVGPRRAPQYIWGWRS